MESSNGRPVAGRRRVVAGWLRIVIHRYRFVRFVAAAVAALMVFSAVGTNSVPEVDLGAAAQLGEDARGVAVANQSTVFEVGDLVDVHELRSGNAVVRSAVVIANGERETLIGVPAELVSVIVNAVMEGGVLLTLVPSDD